METLVTLIQLNRSIGLKPSEINSGIEDTLLFKLREDIEGKCIKEGYVMPNTTEIINRSLGEVQLSHFNGSMLYNVNFTVKICNPNEGDTVEARITNVNKMGILAIAGDGDPAPLNILLPAQYHIDNEDFYRLQPGNQINVKIVGKRFDSGESQISIIGIVE
tara:strand:- start:1627 stop:2112 length:486 start_codon:yes stop_codon:yes gene_type:complete